MNPPSFTLPARQAAPSARPSCIGARELLQNIMRDMRDDPKDRKDPTPPTSHFPCVSGLLLISAAGPAGSGKPAFSRGTPRRASGPLGSSAPFGPLRDGPASGGKTGGYNRLAGNIEVRNP